MRHALISFLNARPLWWGLVHGRKQEGETFTFTSPARCADLIAEGEVDLGLIPAIELLRIPGVVAVPEICIASRTEVRSVLLFSRVPFDQIRSVALDPSSRTSVTLARVLLGERLGAERYGAIKFDPVEAGDGRTPFRGLEGHDAVVVIGDPALQLSRETPPGVRRYDLVSEWNADYGDPFVFAVWAGPGASLTGPESGEIIRRLKESREWGRADIARIAREAAEELCLPETELLEYFAGALHYELGEQEHRALTRFCGLARKWGLADPESRIEWLKTLNSPRSLHV